MNKEMMNVSDNILEIQTLTERIRVLSDDLMQCYFGKELNGKDDAWKIAGDYYYCAGIKAEILGAMVIEADKKLAQLQESLNGNQNVIKD